MTGLETLAGKRRFVLNPVLRRELIERWRGRRAFVVVTIYLAVLMGIMLLLLWAGRTILANDFGFNEQFSDPGPLLGRFLMENLVAFVLLLVLFIGPGYAAAQVSGERERKTLGLLQVTLVRPWSIVAGKLGAAVAWLMLLIVASLPLGAVAFFLGGVTLADLVRALVYVVGIALSVAAIGIGVSSMTRRTTASIVVTYGLVLTLVVGTLFATAIEAVVRRDAFRFGEEVRLVSLMFNPFYGLADAVRSQESFMLPSVLQPFSFGLPQENRRDVVFSEPVGGGFVGDGGGAVVVEERILDGQAAADVLDERASREPVWLQVLGIHLALGAGAMVFASRRVQPGHESRRRRRGSGERIVVAGAPPVPTFGQDLPPPPAPDTRIDATFPPPETSYPPPPDGGSG
jgi:ABC-type transport system involved in multi-copper enzyme maturation permease subunit